MGDEDLTYEDGPRLAEPPQEVPDYTIRIGNDGAAWGPQPTHDAYPNWRPNPNRTADQLVLTPEEFRQGYRLNETLGPPRDITLTEMAHSQVEQAIEYIDEFDPTMAMRLSRSPELMFTVPEIALSLDESFVEQFGGERGAAADRLISALTEEDGRVFKHESLVQVLRSTQGTAEFWSEWGDFFVPKERDIVATLLANVPSEWRDRSAALAYRYLDENRDEIATSQAAMDEFIVWLWNESKKQSESGEFSESALGKFGDWVSTPYYAVQREVGNLYTSIVAPEDQAWRGALSPGQTMAISLGLDPSDSKWTETTAAIDLVGNFVLDPLNVTTGFAFGARAARAIPLAADAAQATRLNRTLKGVIPIFGRRTAENLPIGNRSAWQRLGYHVFAKDVDTLLKTKRTQGIIDDIAQHMADGKGLSALIDKYPDIKPLMGADSGALRLLASGDRRLVEHGMRALLEGKSDNIIHVGEQTARKYELLKTRMARKSNQLANEGRLGTDDLAEVLDYHAAEGVKVVDNPDPNVGVPLVRPMDEARDMGKGGQVWTSAPRTLDITSQDDFPNIIDWVGMIARGPERVQDLAGRQTIVDVVFDPRTGDIAISSQRPRASILDDLAEAGQQTRYEALASGDISDEAIRAAAEIRVRESSVEGVGDSPFFRRVRIKVDPNDPIWTLPDDVRVQVWDSIAETAMGQGVADDMIASQIREVLRNVVQTGKVDEEAVAAINAQSRLPLLYGGFGPSFGGEARALRRGARGKPYARTDTVRPGFGGEGPADITEGAPFLFPNSIYASSDPTLAVAFDDLGNPIREGGLNKPIELVTWNDPKNPPKLLDLDSSSDVVTKIVREEIEAFEEMQEIDIYGEVMRDYLQYQIGEIDRTLDDAYRTIAREYFDEFKRAQEARLGRELTPDEIDELALKVEDIVANEKVMDELHIRAERDWIGSYREKNNGRDPSALELNDFHSRLRAGAVNEMSSAERVAEQYPGSAMAFASADDYFRDIYNLPGWENIERVDDSVRSNFLVQTDIDRLVSLAEEGGISDLGLIYALRQTMESGGYSGRRINKMIRNIENSIQYRSGYDGVYYGRGNKVKPSRARNREEIEFRRAARDRAKQRRQEIQAKYLGERTARPSLSGEPFEVSTKGDDFGRQFSAFNAEIDGRSIEEIYQVDVKGYDSIKAGKGKPPKDTDVDTEAAYQQLWDTWATENPELIDELYQRTWAQGRPLRDRFAREGSVSQDKALSNILERKHAEMQADSLAGPETAAPVRLQEGGRLPPAQRAEYVAELRRSDAIYRQELAQISKSKNMEDKIIAFFDGPNRRVGRVRTGVKTSENFAEFTVPSNEAALRLARRLGGDYFLSLPPGMQADLLDALPRTPMGTPIRGSIDEVESIRPRELPTNVDPEDLRQANVRSLDYEIGSVDESGSATLHDIIPNPDEATSPTGGPYRAPPSNNLELQAQMPPRPDVPPAAQAEMAAPRQLPGQQQLRMEWPNFTTEELEVLRQLGDAKGYDRVMLPGGYELVTKRGQQKIRPVRIGASDADLTELRNLQSRVARASAEKAWADAVLDNEIIGLKQVPQPASRVLDRIIPKKLRESDSFIANWARRFTAGFDKEVGSIPEGVNIYDTNAGYKELRSFLRLMGVKQGDMHRHLDSYVTASIGERYGVLQDIVMQVADEIEHPMMRVRLKDWAASGGVQSYAPTVDEAGELTERTLAWSRTSADTVKTTPLIPSHLSNVYPLPNKELYTELTRFRRGQLLGDRVIGTLSTMGGSKKARIANGKRILSKLEAAGIEGWDMEDALLFGYANASDPETAGLLTKAVRQVKGAKVWNMAHRGFTRVQLAARPFTWFARVVLFDEAARGAIFDMPSMYKHPFSWMSSVVDNYRIQRVGLYRQELLKSVNSEMAQLFRGVRSVDEAVARADSIIPGFLGRVGDEATFANVGEVKRAVYRFIDLDAEEVLGEFSTNFAKNVGRARKAAERANRALSKYNLPADFLWDDVPEIAQKGLVQHLLRDAEHTFKPIQWRPSLMNAADRRNYGRAYGSMAHQFVSDKWGRIALEELASMEAGAKGGGHLRLVNSDQWTRMRQTVAAQAEYAGFNAANDADLARWYLDNKLIPHAEELFRPLFPDDLRNGVLQMVNGKFQTTIEGSEYAFAFRKSASSHWVDQFEKMAERHADYAFPSAVAGHVNPLHRLGDQDSGIVKVANKIIDVAGERATQTLNRRPAWLKQYNREYTYLMERGFDEDLARRIARNEASRKINHVYFNMQDVPYYVERLNRVIPFFSAMYEVTSSWAYKVPLAQSALGWPDGAAMLGRKVDRFINNLIWSGLVEVDDEADEGSPTKTRQLSFVLSHHLPTNNELAAQASSFTRAAMAAPALIAQTLVGFNNELKEIDPDLYDFIDYRIGLGNPIDPFSHGLGSALQLSAGLNPLGSLALGSIRNRSFWAGDARTFDAKEGQTLGEFAEQLDVTPQEVLAWNKELLRKTGTFTDYEISAAQRGLVPLEELRFPKDVNLNVPKSTMFGEIMDQVFFPFDQVESGVGVINGYLPSWSNFVLRGFGLHNAAGQSVPYEVLEDGRVVFSGEDGGVAELTSWFTNFMMPPESRVFMAGEITMALQHLEATEGVLSDYFRIAQRYEDALNAGVSEGLQIIQGDNGLEVLNADDPRYRELEEELQVLRKDLDDHSALIVKRATEIAASTSMTRGFAGLFGPANPRVVYREAEKRALYYESRDAVEHARIIDGELRGVQLPDIGGVTDAEAFFELANLWFDDMSGDGTQRWFREQYPEVTPFLKGRTYWGPGGEPIRSKTYSEYVDRIRDGLERPYTPEIATLINLKTTMDVEREIAIIEAYGNDPAQAAVAILNDWYNYNENIQSEYQNRRIYIDQIDDQMGNPWEDFANRTRENYPLLIDDIYEVFNDAYNDVTLANEVLGRNVEEMTNAELRESVQDLEAAAQGLDRVRDQFNLYFIREDERARNPREELITQYFADVLRPYFEQEAEFRRRLAEPGLSSEDRQKIFIEMREYENEIMNEPAYIVGRDGSRYEVPGRLQYRDISSSPEDSRTYTLRNLHGNPAWNNLYENRQLATEFPALQGLVPTTQDGVARYTELDKFRLAVDQRVEEGEITTYQARQLKEMKEEDIRAELEAIGRGEEAFYMLDAMPAERMRLAGILEGYPYLNNMAAHVREVMDQLEANDEALTGNIGRKAYTMMLEDFKTQWVTDPVFQERVIALADQIGLPPYADQFFARFFLGMFDSDL